MYHYQSQQLYLQPHEASHMSLTAVTAKFVEHSDTDTIMQYT